MKSHGSQHDLSLDALDAQGDEMILRLQESAEVLNTNVATLDRLQDEAASKSTIELDPTSDAGVVDLRLKTVLTDHDQLMVLRESRIRKDASTSRWG